MLLFCFTFFRRGLFSCFLLFIRYGFGQSLMLPLIDSLLVHSRNFCLSKINYNLHSLQISFVKLLLFSNKTFDYDDVLGILAHHIKHIINSLIPHNLVHQCCIIYIIQSSHTSQISTDINIDSVW